MDKLVKAIHNSQMSKQDFAKTSHIPYYRVAEILYGNDCLTKEEERQIVSAFGDKIFL